MKKFYTLLLGGLLSIGGLSANAQEMYLIGPFNNDGTSDMSSWQLKQDQDAFDDAEEDGLEIDPNTVPYTLYKTIPNNQFTVCFKYGNYYLVPAVNGEASSPYVKIPSSGILNTPYIQSTTPVYWTIESFTESDVQFSVTISDQTVSILPDLEDADICYLNGKFNDYNPGDNPQWALLPGIIDEDGDQINGVYQGTFKIPAGEFSLNVKNSVFYFVPWDYQGYGESREITFTDGVYEVKGGDNGFGNAYDNTEYECYWTYKDWDGGWIKVLFSVDADSPYGVYLKITDVTDEMTASGTPELPQDNPEFIYISGSFNQYQPGTNEDWALTLVEDEDEDDVVYVGYITLPANGFYFNFTYGDEAYIVPAEIENNDLVASDSNAIVEFVNGNYSSNFTFGNGTVYWQQNGFQGGEVGISVNVTQKRISFSYTAPSSDQWYISGAFNGYNPGTGASWALTPSTKEEENGIYSGTFNVPAGQFSFNLLNPDGYVYVPEEDYAGVTQVVEFTDDIFTGSIIDAWDASEEKCYWVNADWEGGKIKVAIDLNENTITITDLSETSGVSSLQKVNGEDVIYNINGLKVNKNNIVPGLYIINGKKVLVK